MKEHESIKNILILGSTGSIGKQTLEIVRHHPKLFNVVGLSANTNYQLLNQQIQEFSPDTCTIGNPDLAKYITTDITVFKGSKGLNELCNVSNADIVICAVVGLAGLEPTLICIEKGMKIALANKETLVGGGRLVTNRLKAKNMSIIPIDSEHSAIFQCLQNNENKKALKRIYITASGGPFLRYPIEDMDKITLEQALNHPRWSMGNKITIDSATMMNKGLEVIEARWLFNLKSEQIKVVVHPQSIVHSMVEFDDNALIAQIGNPDMRVPIQYALTYPKRLDSPTLELDLFSMGALEFLKPDFEKFPCLNIAYKALRDEGSRSLVINAANETAVNAFLKKQIKFTDIYKIIEAAYVKMEDVDENSLEDLLALDEKCRRFSKGLI